MLLLVSDNTGFMTLVAPFHHSCPLNRFNATDKLLDMFCVSGICYLSLQTNILMNVTDVNPC